LYYDENRVYSNYYAEEIREEQKKRRLQEVAEKIKGSRKVDLIIDDLREELDKIAAQTGRTEIMSADELQKKDYVNTEFIVEKIVPVGMTLLIGPPKAGKSWLLLLWAQSISMGWQVFGNESKQVPLLYYSLEDSVKRCKYRLNKIISSNLVWPKNLYFAETSRGTIGLMNDIKTTKARVVIIDTFGAFASVKDGNDYYETTRIIREIKEIADTLRVAIIVVHHTRKSSKDSGDDWTAEIMGSQGLVGAADAIISLQRKRTEPKAVLAITGRDISDNYIKINFNNGVWSLNNDK
jgi:RecA-family ATPase